MANSDDTRYKQHEEETAEGHYVRFSHSVHHFSVIPTWQITQVYHSQCKTLPTSWRMVLNFQKSAPNPYFLTLTRYSGIYIPLDVYIWISCFDVNKRRLCFPKVFSKKGILPNEKLQESMTELIPLEEIRILPQEELIIEVSLFICSCHMKESEKTLQTVEISNSDSKRMQFSKL